MLLLSKRIDKGQFFLQNELEPYTDEKTLIEVNRLINQKIISAEIHKPIFDIKSYKERVSVSILNQDNSVLGIIHLKINARKRLYIPKKNEPKVGMSLQRFEKVFRPGVFNVSDECVDKVADFITDWRRLSKKLLKEYKFEPRVKGDIFSIKIYRKNVEYQLFECKV